MQPLGHYAAKFGTDKAPLAHNFTEFYEEMFGQLRLSPIKLVEFGYKFGSSNRMWEESFPRATIFAVDRTFERERLPPTRATKVVVDLTSKEALLAFCRAHGPFDLAIDDSAHTSEVTRNIVTTLLPQWIKPGGWLVIEDINSGFKRNDPRTDQIDYCASLVLDICHNGKLTRCSEAFWDQSTDFEKCLRQIVYRPGIMGIQRR
jgi:hypothetical protein